jgi:D-amino-acid dehydrogenase
MTDTTLPPGASVAIIGAGIVGVASACALARRGYEVVVYDPESPGEAGSSRANAGHVAASDIHPLSTPGIHWKALKMLINPDGPLKIPLRDSFAHIPWFWRFWRTSRGKRFETATRALSYLCGSTLTDTSAMLESAGMTGMLEHKGCAFLYDTEQSFAASKRIWADKNARGFDNEEMDAGRIARDIPSINAKFRHAVLSCQWSQMRDPLDVVRGLAKAAQSHGVIFHRGRVNSLSGELDSVTLETGKGRSRHDAAIIAAGVNSVAFAESCGDFLPMVAERGYNLTIPAPGIELDLPLVFADRGIVATHLTRGLRIGGWAEYARPDRPANQKYFKSMARISSELFPGLNLDNASFWMGNRPSLPDSVPVISRSSHAHRVFYNCGHGHYGLTHAATSARLLCDLVTGDGNLPEYQAYSIDRFK